jgi:hypothetical protein
VAAANQREGREQLRNPLVRVEKAKAADDRVAVELVLVKHELTGGPHGHRDAMDRRSETGCERAVAHVLRVHDQTVLAGELEDLTGEREFLRTRRPERRDAAVDDPEGEQAADDARLAFHRTQVAGDVLAREREARDEVVKNELVQYDEARPAAKRVDDPAVYFGVVSDVVHGEICAARLLPSLGDDDVEALAKRREEQRAVVGDP